ncbi:MAG TPA: 3-hydroxyacyl-CoA dehydrogenase NAD-binding domain-containing protein [Steroidobacteraceae bacterium]|nr:3-hydroxyacyl-CoA dehydrogenase NAD-binding domain-containing protein [Steroidobacteraceae bacterium]
MPAANWSLQIDGDAIAHLLFDAPGSTVNVLSAAAIQELGMRLDELAGKGCRGLIVSSAKKSGFIAGADIKEFTTIKSPAAGRELVRAGQQVLQRLEDLPCASVAAIHGFALGGGLELALACRYRIGAADGKLALGMPEVQLGIHPGFGGTVRSVRLIGVRAAMELMLQGKPFHAERALASGLIDRLVPPADLLVRAKALLADPPARRSAPLADKLLNAAPLRPLVARRLQAALRRRVPRAHYPAPYAIVDLWRKNGASPDSGYLAEAHSIAELMCTPSSRNLVRVFLLQDRLKAQGGKSKQEFRRLHVIGGGVMGGDIAAWSALRGMQVTLQDRSEELLQPALARAKTLFEKRLKDPEAAAAAAARLRMDVGGEAIADADVVIEAIFEDVDAKRALYATIEPRLKADAIFATNTSSITLEVLCAELRDPGRLVGIHFFNPVAQMQLVEIVRGTSSRAEIVDRALAFTRRIDKLPLPCRSAPGFVVNRILVPYINEAMFAYEDGVPAEAIDAAGKQFGMPMGPIELADVIGLDVALHVGRVLADAFQRRVPEVLTRLVEEKKFGRKSGQGFYSWRAGKPLRPAGPPPVIAPDLTDRLILPMVNEAVATWRERVIEDADLLDAAAVFATGFAPFRGGPLQYARERGVAEVQRRLGELAQRYGERFLPDAGWSQLPA